MAAALDDYRWLTSDAARPWLQRASAAGDPALLVPRMRKDLSAERAHLVAEQADLRRRAREKFALADQMFFTRKGLEQATDETLAACKAGRFPQGAKLADLCCGIGGDLLALAQRGSAAGLDLNPIVRLLAEANADAWGLSRDRCAVVGDDAAQASIIRGFDGWHCDPDRRSAGRRTVEGEHFEPSLDVVAWLLGHNPNGAIKVAPATILPPDWQENAELEWLSSRGECRQQVAWFGALAQYPGRRSATVVDGSLSPRTIVGLADEPVPVAPAVARYLYEPDAAILAAHLSGALCRELGLAAVSPGIAYLTSDEPVRDDALAAFEVRDVLPFDRKQLKGYCREHRLGRLEVKKRGIDLDPEKLRTEVIGKGEEQATLIVMRHSGKVLVAVVEPRRRQGDTERELV